MLDFPNRLKEKRKNRGYTQEKIAQMLDIGQSAYAKWENGRTEPTLENIVKLSSILDTTTDELLGQTKFSMINYVPLRDIDISKIQNFSSRELDTFKHSIWIQAIQDRRTLQELANELEEIHMLDDKQKKILTTITAELQEYLDKP
ncbi:helix-turn-helix domain-containing protein [Streptococcus fryi]